MYVSSLVTTVKDYSEWFIDQIFTVTSIFWLVEDNEPCLYNLQIMQALLFLFYTLKITFTTSFSYICILKLQQKCSISNVIPEIETVMLDNKAPQFTSAYAKTKIYKHSFFTRRWQIGSLYQKQTWTVLLASPKKHMNTLQTWTAILPLIAWYCPVMFNKWHLHLWATCLWHLKKQDQNDMLWIACWFFSFFLFFL